MQLTFKQCRGQGALFPQKSKCNQSQPSTYRIPNLGGDLEQYGFELHGSVKLPSIGGKWCTWTCAVQTGVVQESAVLAEVQVSVLAHMSNILVSFLLLTFQPCVNSHFNCHYLYSQDILLTIFLYTSLQLEVYSRSHNGCFIWKPYDRNLHWHSVSGRVGNSENLRFYFQIHPQLNQTLPFS